MLWTFKCHALLIALFLTSAVAFSQIGPMGIGNKDGTPTSAGPQPKLVLWLDGSSADPYVAQAPVDTWQDKSGNGHNFVPSSMVQRPSLRVDGDFSGPKGSFPGAPSTPCIRFIDNSAHLQCPNFELPGSGYSIYFVMKSEQDNYGLFNFYTPTEDREMLIYNDNGLRHQMGSVDRGSAINYLSDVALQGSAPEIGVNGGDLASPQGIYLNVGVSSIFKTARIQSFGTGTKTFQLRSGHGTGGAILDQIDVELVPGVQEVAFDFEMDPAIDGTQFTLMATGSGPNLFRTNSNVNYPYIFNTVGGDEALRIVNSSAGTGFYYWFYDPEFEVESIEPVSPYVNWNYGGITLRTSDANNWEYTKDNAFEGGFGTFDGITFDNEGSAFIGEIKNPINTYPSSDNFEGFIAEIIIFEGRLSRPETRLLRTYFWIKYGLNGDGNEWDKFNSNMALPAGESWGGKYYAPVGIGRESSTPNSGSVNEARSAGLVLRVNQEDWTQTRSYLCAAPVGDALAGLEQNNLTSDDLTGEPSVLERWTRLWEISGETTHGNDQFYQIAFDFEEGINGTVPQNAENFVLLSRANAASGDFSILPIPSIDKFVVDDELVFRVRKQDLLDNGPYFTIGTTDVISSLTGEIRRTWYAYQSGNWSDPDTWTLDGSNGPAYVNPNNQTPNLFDNIYIGAGRNVVLDDTLTLPELTDLRVFGTLDLASAAQPNFQTIGGSGLIRCAAGNFPTGNSAAFADPESGGTLEFYGSGGFTQSTDLEVNKLVVNLANTPATVTLAANLTTNGLFEVNRGTFVVNDGSSSTRMLTSHATVLVESPGRIIVNNTGGNRKHAWYFHRDLINNGGELRFTNRTAADENITSYSSPEVQHIITAHFSNGSNNQELRANGLSYFSRIVVDKGVDQTYVFSLSADDPGHFKLLGPCNGAMSEAEFSPAEPIPGNNGNLNSFALVNGTAEIRENIFIPLQITRPLSGGGCVGNYNINNTAQLWVNGGEVTKGPLGGLNCGGNAIVVYGKIKVSAGVLNSYVGAGIVVRDNGVVEMAGGTLNTNVFQTSSLGFTALGGLTMSGGTMNVNGNFPGGARNGWHNFSLTYPGNLFRMTGGTLNVTGPSNTGLFFVNSDPQNINVTGGTVHFDVSNTSNSHNIATRAPFWNLTLTRSSTGTQRNFRVIGGTSGPSDANATLPVLDLVVRNNFSISGPNSPAIEMGTTETPADLIVSGNFTMGAGSGYIHRNNTTRFVGDRNSTLTFEGSSTFPFYNVTVDKDLDERFATIQETGPNPAIDVLGNLNVEKGYFRNNKRQVFVRGNITNRSQIGDDAGAQGSIWMNGNSGRQNIISEGGIMYDLMIDNPQGVALQNDGLTIKNRLRFQSGSFFIGDHKLRLASTYSSPISGWNATDRFIVCSGNAAAGGVEILNHAAVQLLSYPIGVSTGAGQKYTWAEIRAVTEEGPQPDPDNPVASGGEESYIEDNGTFYKVHTFSESGTLNVLQGGDADCLIVGGGGASGNRIAGGGGGGGVRLLTPSVTPQAYPIVVGQGGQAPTSSEQTELGTNGENSSAFGETALGGGRGGVNSNIDGTSGGSGGGGRGNTDSSGGSGTPGQGNAGGSSAPGLGGAGGGGAGGPGQNGQGPAYTAGDGGPGISSDISGTLSWYGGGGAGGAGTDLGAAVGGIGGGGDGGQSSGEPGQDGEPGTGGGGGGGGFTGSANALGGSGGSGIVIVRYEITAEEYESAFLAEGGFIGVTPVDTLLSTADLSGSPDYLNFYWKVSTSGFDVKPDVSHRFAYVPDDVIGNLANFEAGRVLSHPPFTRAFDDSPSSSHVGAQIWYNGPDVAQSLSGEGTLLVDADYTAGAADRFPIGSAPDVFYSRNGTDIGADWENPANWNKLSDCVGCTDIYDYHSTSSPASVSEYPQEGDIAIIGFDVDNGDYRPHVYKAPPGGIQAAQVIFTPLQNAAGERQPRYEGPAAADLGILRPTLEISATADIINLSQISGEGALMLKGNIDLGVTGLADFLAEDSSFVVINSGTGASTAFNFLPAEVPNLFLAEAEPIITSDLRIRDKLEVAGNSKLYLSETQGGNIEVNGDLILDTYQYSGSGGPSLLFNTKGDFKTVNVSGDVKLSGTTAHIGIDPAGTPPGPPVPWTPQELDAFIWLDATQGVTTSGSGVTEWTDQASGYVAAQTDSGKRPTYQIGMNGLNTVRFDGTDDFLAIPHDDPLNINQNQDFEIFSVSDCNNPTAGPPDGYPVIYGKGRLENRNFLLYVALNTYRIHMDAGRMNVIAPNLQGTGDNLGWVRRQGNSGFLFNTTGGFSSATGVSNARMNGNPHDVTIGAALNGTVRFWDGDISEIILIKRALTTEERLKTEGYLAHKWGLADELPDGHPYKLQSAVVGVNEDSRAQLIVGGNIIQDLSDNTPVDNGLELYKISADTAIFANLVLTGPGTNEFINNGGPAPRLWKMTVDKGSDITSGFTFNTDVSIDGYADEQEKPVNIRNGLLKFNDPALDITLSSGGDDFVIPPSGGLELNQGSLNISGLETGILLSGLLKITGGALTVGNSDQGNNYIEYSGSGTSRLFIEGGTLVVGSQIRRPLSTTEGALDYRQSGGDVTIGRFSAPATGRGMLEVLNPGSRFEHTAGTLTFVRGVNSAATPSFRLTPEIFNVGSGSEITIGNSDSPSGAEIENFGLQSSIALNHLTINSDNAPVVRLISNNLELNGDLTIQTGATLDCNDRDLFLNGDVTNEGFLNSASGIVTLNHLISGTVTGSGTFDLYDLKRSGSGGTTLVETSLLIKNNLFHDIGEMNFGDRTLTVKGNVTTDGALKFDTGAGLVMDGEEGQILSRTFTGSTEIDILTINNEDGITIPAGFNEFVINRELRMINGVFSLTGNLLDMAEGAVFTPVNPFGEGNMIVTGGSFTDFGVRVRVPANANNDIFVPLGVDRFMPINLDFSGSTGSSGSTPSSYLLRLNVPENGIIQPADLNNVLGMYFSVDGSNVGDGLDVNLKFRYHNQYVQVSNPNTEADYIAARVFPDNTTVAKFGTSAVDEVNDIITFNIQGDFAGNPTAVDGDYFAGIDPAIPSTIPVYITNRNGFAHLGNSDLYLDEEGDVVTVPGGGAPSGAIVIIDSDHTLNFILDGFNFYRTEIREGATLSIALGTSQHRLGRVTGNGTLKIFGTGVLPAGNYTDFLGCGGGKLEYNAASSQDFEILANMPPIEEVTLSGTTAGTMTVASSAVNICKNLNIVGRPNVRASNAFLLSVGENIDAEGPLLDFRQGEAQVEGDFRVLGWTNSSNNLIGGAVTAGNNGSLFIQGDLMVESGDFGLGTLFRETRLEGDLGVNTEDGSISGGTGGAKLIFEGIFPQNITGNLTGTSKIPFVELNNGTGLTLNGSLEVSDTLKLSDGNIFTTQENMLRLTEDRTAVDPVGGRPNSFVDGPMQWSIANSSPERRFPVGKNNRHRPLIVSNANTAQTWEVEYTDTIARIVPSIDPSMLPDPMNIPPIETVSVQEFWRVETKGSVRANVGLSWGDESAVSTNPIDQTNLLVLGYNDDDSVWNSYGGQEFIYNAMTNSGLVRSVAGVPWAKPGVGTQPDPDPANVAGTGGEESVFEEDGSYYKVHTFLEDGNFEVLQGGDVEYLIVGAGGGGGTSTNRGASGGGAGGVLSGTHTATTGTFNMVVGEGGEGCPASNAFASPGGNSSAFSLTAIGGGAGRGSTHTGTSNIDGGSGGGGVQTNSTVTNPGQGTPGQGMAGGFSFVGGSGAGGGGFSSVGGNGGSGDGAAGGVGGAGLISSFSGVEMVYAAGGAGSGNSSVPVNTFGGAQGAGASAAANSGSGGNASLSNENGGNGGSGIVLVRYEITEEEYNAFSIPRFLTLGSSSDVNPLPVTWLYFRGENKGEDNLLSWATASEHNNDYFELERSLDAQSWNVIGQIPAAGYSNTKQTYNYTDRDAPFGRVYYRLKQVDFDGTLDFAPNIVSLEKKFLADKEGFDFMLYPNPTQIGTVRFRMSNTADVVAQVWISDLSGQMLSQSNVYIDGQGTSAPVNCNYQPGIYLVTVIVNDKMRSKPLVVTR